MRHFFLSLCLGVALITVGKAQLSSRFPNIFGRFSRLHSPRSNFGANKLSTGLSNAQYFGGSLNHQSLSGARFQIPSRIGSARQVLPQRTFQASSSLFQPSYSRRPANSVSFGSQLPLQSRFGLSNQLSKSLPTTPGLSLQNGLGLSRLNGFNGLKNQQKFSVPKGVPGRPSEQGLSRTLNAGFPQSKSFGKIPAFPSGLSSEPSSDFANQFPFGNLADPHFISPQFSPANLGRPLSRRPSSGSHGDLPAAPGPLGASNVAFVSAAASSSSEPNPNLTRILDALRNRGGLKPGQVLLLNKAPSSPFLIRPAEPYVVLQAKASDVRRLFLRSEGSKTSGFEKAAVPRGIL